MGIGAPDIGTTMGKSKGTPSGNHFLVPNEAPGRYTSACGLQQLGSRAFRALNPKPVSGVRVKGLGFREKGRA